MKRDENFTAWVQQALDERRDPLEDERIQDAIVADPERLEELERLLARIRGLRDPARRRRLRTFLVAATLVILAALGLQRLAERADRAVELATGPGSATSAPLERTSAPRVDAGALAATARPAGLPEGRVLSFEWEIVRETPEERRLTLVDAHGTTTRTEFLPARGLTAPALAVWTTESTRYRRP
jgi:hypothetical protein